MPSPAQYPENEEVLAALRFLHREIAALRTQVAQLAGGAPQAAAAPAVAPDSDLDGQYGDEQIKKDPPRWKGSPTAPCRMSECSPEYLDELAEYADKLARKRARSEKAG